MKTMILTKQIDGTIHIECKEARIKQSFLLEDVINIIETEFLMVD